MSGGFKPRGKVENDLVNAGRLVAGLFGVDVTSGAIQNGVEEARKHVGDIEGSDGVHTYVECPSCHTHYDEAKACPVCAPPPEPKPRTKGGPVFCCAWDASGKYKGAYVSPYQALDNAGPGGRVERRDAGDLPED